MPVTFICGRPIKYEVKKHRGNMIFIEVKPSGILLKLPESLNKRPEEVIKEHEAEISEKLLLFESLERLAERHAYDLRHRLLLLGEFVDLNVVLCPKREVKIGQDGIEVMAPSKKEAYSFLREAFKTMLRKIVSELIDKFSAKLGIKPEGLRIVTHKKAWASLTDKNIITIALKSLALPPEYLKYVVAHEITHLVRRSHDKVAKILVRTLAGSEVSLEDLTKYEFLVSKCVAWRKIIMTLQQGRESKVKSVIDL